MKFEKTEVWGFEHAIRGMRNPLESWDKSDSLFCCHKTTDEECKKCSLYNDEEQCRRTIRFQQETNISFYIIGKNDIALMQKLVRAGSEHRKFMRQIFVSVDITAPLYWWKEFDTYKVGTVSNSTSTMHKLTSTPITMDCFECGEWIPENTIKNLEGMRNCYNETKNKTVWKKLIVNLPESWLQKRTIIMNYENILNMYKQRCIYPHKLNEWSGRDNSNVPNFKSWVESLPYAKELICIKVEK